ncbi:MAG: TIGR02206 family membrane protein [Spirochaetota bacterium]
MSDFFAYEYDYGFKLFSTTHIMFMIGLVIIWIVLLVIMKNVKDEKARKKFRYVLAIILFITETIRIIWLLIGDAFILKEHLPLHLCGVIIYVCCIMLITKNQTIFDICFFLGLGGALQPIVTPGLRYAFPHFIYFQAFIAHGGIFFSVLYMLIIEKMRPKNLLSLVKVFIWGNVYMAVVYVINLILDSNYMYLMGPTPNPSLVDILIKIFGEPPLHIIGLELIAIATFIIIYMPFLIKDIISKIKKNEREKQNSMVANK